MTEPTSRPEAASATARRSAALSVLGLLGLLVLCTAAMAWAWVEMGDVAMSTHGMIALGLGAGLTLLCGAGLMGLVFYSSRRGYDERAHEWSRDRDRRGPE